MLKNTTSSKMVDLNNKKQSAVVKNSLEPKRETLNLILQFASSYRVEKTTKNQFIELCLN